MNIYTYIYICIYIYIYIAVETVAFIVHILHLHARKGCESSSLFTHESYIYIYKNIILLGYILICLYILRATFMYHRTNAWFQDGLCPGIFVVGVFGWVVSWSLLSNISKRFLKSSNLEVWNYLTLDKNSRFWDLAIQDFKNTRFQGWGKRSALGPWKEGL